MSQITNNPATLEQRASKILKLAQTPGEQGYKTMLDAVQAGDPAAKMALNWFVTYENVPDQVKNNIDKAAKQYDEVMASGKPVLSAFESTITNAPDKAARPIPTGNAPTQAELQLQAAADQEVLGGIKTWLSSLPSNLQQAIMAERAKNVPETKQQASDIASGWDQFLNSFKSTPAQPLSKEQAAAAAAHAQAQFKAGTAGTPWGNAQPAVPESVQKLQKEGFQDNAYDRSLLEMMKTNNPQALIDSSIAPAKPAGNPAPPVSMTTDPDGTRVLHFKADDFATFVQKMQMSQQADPISNQLRQQALAETKQDDPLTNMVRTIGPKQQLR